MYDAGDPRSALAAGVEQRPPQPWYPFARSTYVRIPEHAPSEANPPTWWVRGANVVVGYTQLLTSSGDFVLDSSSDEWILLLPDKATRAAVEVGGERREYEGGILVVVPPGDAHVGFSGSGAAVEILPVHASEAVTSRALNAKSYETVRFDVAPIQRWAPYAGYRFREYGLTVEPEPGRFGRIWQSSSLMINYLDPTEGPRDRRKLSPHAHDDFEQISLALQGSYVHHLRWPWGLDANQWMNDEHERCPAPSITIIPPRILHTSEAVSAGTNQLLDIFAPPRRDFVEQGWVLNADEYQAPKAAGAGG